MAARIGNPPVSIVIVTWNRRDDVLESVRSIYEQDYPDFEVIVVDNASTDGTADALREAYPAVRVIELERNAGASGGRNHGIEAASGEIIFTLDSDASLEKDTLEKVVRKMQEEPDVGVLSCKFLNSHTGRLDPYTWHFTEGAKALQDTEFSSYSFCAAGGAIRREVIERVGGFSEMMFIYREEDDLSLRVWDAGYRVIYFPEAVVYHRASPRQRANRGRKGYLDLRNSLYVYFMHYPWWMMAFFVPLKITSSVVKGIKGGYVSESFRALLDFIKHLPSLHGQRRPIDNKTARLYLELQREHGPLSWNLASWLKHKA